MNTHTSFMEKMRWRLNVIDNKFTQFRRTTSETAVVDTEYGKVKGRERLSIYDELYYSFEGIPYAQPPIGELRFKAPQRPTPWQGIKDCTDAKDKSVQVHFIFNKVEGSEDCLYLNVYTNNPKPESKRPVMVWIHGGGFIMGEANRDFYGADYFMKKDVVLVTIQYRLGSLGFLSLGTPELNIPGNAGLKDQVLALKWIKNNCANFGGNPECITVFGESAGAASTHFMLLTQQAQGLFQRAILMSGNAMCPWATNDCKPRAYTLAKLAGYKGAEDEAEIFKFLQKAKAKDLIRVEEKVLTADEHKRKILFAFGPTIEPYATADAIIPKHPKEMMKTAWGNSIPIMLGNTSFEGLFLLPETKLNPNIVKSLVSCVDLLPAEIADHERAVAETIENGLKIKKAHVKGEIPTAEEYMDLLSQKLFWFPMHRVILSRLAHAAGAPMYLYRFDFDSEALINPFRIQRMGRGVKGVSHTDELTYLFSSFLAHRLPKDSREYRTIERVVAIWTEFATTGNPYDDQIDGMDALTWEPLKKSDECYKCMNISDDLKFINLPEMEKIKIWESVFENDIDLLC